MPKFLSNLLLPFAWLYGLLVSLRHALYSGGIYSRTSFDFPVICIGNLTVGGTGKTPHIEWLLSKLIAAYKPAVISRGYKRKTSGYLLATNSTSVTQLGDEPYQIYSKFKHHHVGLAVCENRTLGIPQLLADCAEADVVLMDDGFQHLGVLAGFNIILTDYSRPYFSDKLLPAGLLRENIKYASGADVIVVTKCPEDLSKDAQEFFISKIKPLTHQKVYFSTILYGTPIAITDAAKQIAAIAKQPVLILSGIAKAHHFNTHLQKHFNVVHKLNLADHVVYRDDVIQQIAETYSQQHCEGILTTEKDAVKLSEPSILAHLQHIPIWYVPIQINILFNQEVELLSNITQYINNYSYHHDEIH